MALDRLLDAWPAERRILWCDEHLAGARDALLYDGIRGPWAILIGPEGGFSEAEQARLRAMPQVVPVSLGPRILRADTAAVAALTLWQALGGLAMSLIRPEGPAAPPRCALARGGIGGGVGCPWSARDAGGGLCLAAAGALLVALGVGLGLIALRRLRFAQDGDAPGVVEVDEGADQLLRPCFGRVRGVA